MADPARLDELRRQYAAHPRRYFAPLASALRRAGDPQAAVAVVRARLAESPDHLTGYVILGQALADAGDHAGARAAFERAHALDDGNVVALQSLVGIARAEGDDAAAARWTALLYEADPEPVGAAAAAAREVADAEPGGFELLDYTEVASVPAPSVNAAAEPAEFHAAPDAVVPDDVGTPGAVPNDTVATLGGDDDAEDMRAEEGRAEQVRAEAPVEVAVGDAPAFEPLDLAAELPPEEPAVGLDEPPSDPLPAPMRAALPELLADPSLDGADVEDTSRGLDESAVVAAPPAAPFVTETMAGLLASQGHTAQALDVYTQLLAQRPGDPRLLARVAELRGGRVEPAEDEPAVPNTDAVPNDEADERAARMWRAALAPVPQLPLPQEPVPQEAAPAPEPDAAAVAPAAVAPATVATAAEAADPAIDDLSFDRFFEPFGDEPAPAEPAGDFERWAAEVDREPAPPTASVAPPVTAAPAARPAPAPAPPPDDPEADLAAFNAWLRSLAE